jgi:hypothetical protein
MKKLMYLKRFNEGINLEYEEYFSNRKVDIKRSLYVSNLSDNVVIGSMSVYIKEGDKPECCDIIDGIAQCMYYNYIDSYVELKNIKIEPQDLKSNDWTQPLFYLCGGYNVLWGENGDVSWSDVKNDVSIFEPELKTVVNKCKNLYELFIHLSLFSNKVKKQMPEIIQNAIAKKDAGKFGI